MHDSSTHTIVRHAEQRRAGDDAGASTDPHASTHALAAAFAAAHPPLPGRTDAADRSAATDTDADAADTDGGEQTGEDEHANPRVMVQRDVPDEDVAAPGWVRAPLPSPSSSSSSSFYGSRAIIVYSGIDVTKMRCKCMHACGVPNAVEGDGRI